MIRIFGDLYQSIEENRRFSWKPILISFFCIHKWQ
jgi:hypothetical protein